MKKRFSRRRNSIVGAYPWMGPVALGLIALVLVAGTLRFLFPGVLITAGTPFWSAGTMLTAGVGNVGSFFTDKASLMEERDRLLAENAALQTAQATTDAKVQDLERLLGSRTEPVGGILAGVVARPPVSPYDVLIVDAGSDAGVAVDAQVAGAGGLPLGTVESVTGKSSRVLLYSTPARETQSLIGDARIPVTLVGEGAGSMSAMVAREAGISVGDMVYVTGPGAVALGSVVSVGNDPSSPRSRVEIMPLANPFSMTWVTIAP